MKRVLLAATLGLLVGCNFDGAYEAWRCDAGLCDGGVTGGGTTTGGGSAVGGGDGSGGGTASTGGGVATGGGVGPTGGGVATGGGAGPTGGGTMGCGPNLTECGGQCVDLQSNPLHCSACDTPCAVGAGCASGTCMHVTPPSHCGLQITVPDAGSVSAGACHHIEVEYLCNGAPTQLMGGMVFEVRSTNGHVRYDDWNCAVWSQSPAAIPAGSASTTVFVDLRRPDAGTVLLSDTFVTVTPSDGGALPFIPRAELDFTFTGFEDGGPLLIPLPTDGGDCMYLPPFVLHAVHTGVGYVDARMSAASQLDFTTSAVVQPCQARGSLPENAELVTPAQHGLLVRGDAGVVFQATVTPQAVDFVGPTTQAFRTCFADGTTVSPLDLVRCCTPADAGAVACPN